MAYVLIIDDEPDGCEVVRTYLTRAGHTVRCAGGGREALAELMANVPDAILLDLLMPKMDGFEVLETIRAYVRWATVPVAVLTAYPEDPRLWHVGGQGVNQVFAKSKVKLDAILNWVNDQAGKAPPPRGWEPPPAPQGGV
jgi:CheY-like chemotaxis protein